MQLFADGVLTPLPYRAFDADAASDAFRLMQQSGHIGKIVLRPPAGQAGAEPASRPAATRIAADATYLVAGGTGGFGFATAKWLAAEGARHLVLVSRSGKLEAAAETERQALREAGVTVRVEPVDITDRAAVQRLIEEIEAQGPPLKGVFHSAMVLDDSLLANLDRARYAAVLAPKVAGIEALDAATAGLDLDLFVMFSSITTAIGNPGQANYVAANAYLEAVAHRRRAAGKPALAIGWGPIGDVGVIARDQEVSELLGRKIGRNTLHSAEALAALGELLEGGAATSGDPVVFIGRLDWAAAAKDLAVLKTPLFARISVEAAMSDGSGLIDLEAELAGLSTSEALQRVSELLAAEMSRILKLPAEQIDKHRPLSSIGMDSLMALELRMAAEQRLGVEIPLMSLASGATLSDIARRILEKRQGDGSREKIDEDEQALLKSHVGESTLPDSETIGSIKTQIEERTSRMRKIM
jgi:NADP-dependent 3-hydroxy acid dehydrogenase YdfG/acyl carrier protein